MFLDSTQVHEWFCMHLHYVSISLCFFISFEQTPKNRNPWIKDTNVFNIIINSDSHQFCLIFSPFLRVHITSHILLFTPNFMSSFIVTYQKFYVSFICTSIKAFLFAPTLSLKISIF